jgi:hypothetical protein
MAAAKLVSVCLVPNRHLWSKQLTEIDKWTVRLFIFRYIGIRGTCCRVLVLGALAVEFMICDITCTSNHMLSSAAPIKQCIVSHLVCLNDTTLPKGSRMIELHQNGLQGN